MFGNSWPIRWRLSALTTGILAAALAALGGVLLWQLDDALVNITADHLREQARLAVPDPPRPVNAEPQQPKPAQKPFGLPPAGPPANAPGPPPPQAPSPFTLQRIANDFVRRLSAPDTGVTVFNANNNIVATGETLEASESWPSATREQQQAVLAGTESRWVIPQASRRVLQLLLPVRAPDGQIVGVLQISHSLDLIDAIAGRLRLVFGGGTLIAVFIVGLASVLGTRAALRPLERVVEAARRLDAGRLDERLRMERRDEIGTMADALDAMLDRLAAVLAAQRRFVADAAHELRTPLTALSGNVEMLQMGADRGDPATIRRLLNTMEGEINRLVRLVSDLLTLSRLDAERPLRAAPLDVAALLNDVAQQVRVLAHHRHVTLSVEHRSWVLGDADQLRQVVLNLADNAIKFTPEQGKITIGAHSDGHQVRIWVTDSGPGISPDILPDVTERFVRADPSRTRRSGGAGLGLAIARGIVEAHGGTLHIESVVGDGTTVFVHLPRIAAPTVSANPQE